MCCQGTAFSLPRLRRTISSALRIGVHDFARVHPEFDDLERNLARYRFGLLCKLDRTHAAPTDFLDKSVAINQLACSFTARRAAKWIKR